MNTPLCRSLAADRGWRTLSGFFVLVILLAGPSRLLAQDIMVDEPPRKNGKPVVVRAQIPVDFVPPKPKQPAGQK